MAANDTLVSIERKLLVIEETIANIDRVKAEQKDKGKRDSMLEKQQAALNKQLKLSLPLLFSDYRSFIKQSVQTRNPDLAHRIITVLTILEDVEPARKPKSQFLESTQSDKKMFFENKRMHILRKQFLSEKRIQARQEPRRKRNTWLI